MLTNLKINVIVFFKLQPIKINYFGFKLPKNMDELIHNMECIDFDTIICKRCDDETADYSQCSVTKEYYCNESNKCIQKCISCKKKKSYSYLQKCTKCKDSLYLFFPTDKYIHLAKCYNNNNIYYLNGWICKECYKTHTVEINVCYHCCLNEVCILDKMN